MKSLWKLFSGLTSAGRGARGPAARPAGTSSSPYPNTFKPPGLVDRAGATFRVPRAQIFDPALRHFSRAFRLGDPEFADPGVARRWQAARRAATRHVLRVIARSDHADDLVL